MSNFNLVEINYLNINENEEYEELIKNVVEEAFKIEKLESSNLYLNIILTDPNNIRVTNNIYRKIDKETDVLSFPMFERNEIENIKENGNEILETLGDIMISIERVKEQAKEYSHSFERELAYMVIHGFYHLMGYDHIEECDRKEMRLKEENVLNILNIVR